MADQTTRPAHLPRYSEIGSNKIADGASIEQNDHPTGTALASASYNRLKNKLSRWTQWFDHYTKNHAHTGGAGDLEAPKIDLNTEVSTDFGSLFTSSVSGNDVLAFLLSAGTKAIVRSNEFRADMVLRISGSAVAPGLELTQKIENSEQGLEVNGGGLFDFINIGSFFPSPDQELLAPKKTSLYVGNLVKSRVSQKINFVNSGGNLVVSFDAYTSYNQEVLTAWQLFGVKGFTIVPDADNWNTAIVNVSQNDSESGLSHIRYDYFTNLNAIVLYIYVWDPVIKEWKNLRTHGIDYAGLSLFVDMILV